MVTSSILCTVKINRKSETESRNFVNIAFLRGFVDFGRILMTESIHIMMIEGDNMLAFILKKMVRCILGESDEKPAENRRMREINFLNPKLDYLNAAHEKLSA